VLLGGGGGGTGKELGGRTLRGGLLEENELLSKIRKGGGQRLSLRCATADLTHRAREETGRKGDVSRCEAWMEIELPREIATFPASKETFWSDFHEKGNLVVCDCPGGGEPLLIKKTSTIESLSVSL